MSRRSWSAVGCWSTGGSLCTFSAHSTRCFSCSGSLMCAHRLGANSASNLVSTRLYYAAQGSPSVPVRPSTCWVRVLSRDGVVLCAKSASRTLHCSRPGSRQVWVRCMVSRPRPAGAVTQHHDALAPSRHRASDAGSTNLSAAQTSGGLKLAVSYGAFLRYLPLLTIYSISTNSGCI